MENERHVNVFARIPGAVALVVAITSVASADIIIDRTTITTVASGQSTTRAASNVLDGDLGLAGSPDNTMWVTPNQSTWEAVALQWIKFDLGAEYELSTIKVWNYNEGSAANWLKRGLKQADIQYAATQADYLPRSPGWPTSFSPRPRAIPTRLPPTTRSSRCRRTSPPGTSVSTSI